MNALSRTPMTLVARVTRTMTPSTARAISTTQQAQYHTEQPRFSTNGNASAVHSLGREQVHTQNKGDVAGYTTFAGSATANRSVGKDVWCVAGASGRRRALGMSPWALLLSAKSSHRVGGGPFEKITVFGF